MDTQAQPRIYTVKAFFPIVSGRKASSTLSESTAQANSLQPEIVSVLLQVIDKKELDGLSSVAREARNAINELTVPWDDGSRAFPASRGEQIATLVAHYASEYNAEAARLAEKWPQLIEDARERLGDQWSEAYVVPADKLRDKLVPHHTMSQVTTPDDFRYAGEKAAALQAQGYKQQTDQLSKALFQAVYESILTLTGGLSDDAKARKRIKLPQFEQARKHIATARSMLALDEQQSQTLAACEAYLDKLTNNFTTVRPVYKGRKDSAENRAEAFTNLSTLAADIGQFM
jgi:hypothetical protein